MPESVIDMQTIRADGAQTVISLVLSVHFDTIKWQMITAYFCYTTVTLMLANWLLWKTY